MWFERGNYLKYEQYYKGENKNMLKTPKNIKKTGKDAEDKELIKTNCETGDFARVKRTNSPLGTPSVVLCHIHRFEYSKVLPLFLLCTLRSAFPI